MLTTNECANSKRQQWIPNVEDEGELNQERTAHEKEGGDKTEAEVALDEAVDEGRGGQADKKVADDEEHGNQTEVEIKQMWKQQRKRKIETSQKNRGTKRQRTECVFFQCKNEEINLLLQENRELRCELNKSKMDEDPLKSNTDKVRYYTGILCFAILLSLFYSVKDLENTWAIAHLGIHVERVIGGMHNKYTML